MPVCEREKFWFVPRCVHVRVRIFVCVRTCFCVPGWTCVWGVGGWLGNRESESDFHG